VRVRLKKWPLNVDHKEAFSTMKSDSSSHRLPFIHRHFFIPYIPIKLFTEWKFCTHDFEESRNKIIKPEHISSEKLIHNHVFMISSSENLKKRRRKSCLWQINFMLLFKYYFFIIIRLIPAV
jgi:hypothetical protein